MLRLGTSNTSKRLDVSKLSNLIPWEYKVSGGYTARGFYTEPTGRPVLHFVHGNGFCGLSYEVLLSQLQEDVDIFISDAQGHGNSDAGDKYVGWNNSAKHIAEVWEHFSPMYGDVPRIASGHSYGAIMSTLIMGRRADLFDFALLLDPTFAPPAMARMFSALGSVGVTKNLPLAKQARVRGVEWENEGALWDYFHQRGVFKGWRDECLQSYLDNAMAKQRDGRYLLKCPPHIEASIFATYARGLWRAISRVRVPVTMYYGEKTFPFILKSRSKIRQSNPMFDFCEMPGGHCFMQEVPELIAHEMKRKIRMRLS